MELQDKIVQERSENADTVPKYVRGDLVLWDPRENPCDMLPSKLDANFVGPFEVLEQVHNDVKCRHVVLETEQTLVVRIFMWGDFYLIFNLYMLFHPFLANPTCLKSL